MKKSITTYKIKSCLLTCVILFETVFAGYIPANAATRSTLESVSENTTVFEDDFSAQEENTEVQKLDDSFQGAGSWNQNFSWNLNSEGHLIINGQGNYETDSGGKPPWYEYRQYIKTATVTVTDITDTSYMFHGCNNLTDIDLTNLDTSKVQSMRSMFGNCYSLTKLDLSMFNTQNVTSMASMFWDCRTLKELDLQTFDTKNVTDMSNMFWSCNELTTIKLDTEKFKTSNVTQMYRMFESCNKLESIDVSGFDTSKVKDLRFLFAHCKSLTELNVDSFDTGNVENFNYMFYDCSNLTELDVSHFVTTSAKDMTAMFYDCKKLVSLDLSSFTTNNVTQMPGMFCGCNNLTSINIEHFDTSKVENINLMFSGCYHLHDLDLSMLDFSSVTSATNIISETYELNRIVFPDMSIDVTLDKIFYDENGTAFDKISAHSGKVKGYSEEYTKTYCYINGHAFEKPIFTWNGTESATAYYKCTMDQCDIENEQTLNAVITSETIPATTESEGKIIYTATVVVLGKTYSDVKIVVTPKLEKKPENTQTQTNTESSKNDNAISKKLSVGTKFKYSGANYKVTKVTSTGGEVQYLALQSKKVKTAKVPATIKVNGITYKVTSIASNAFKNSKKLTKVTIGKNVNKIGSKAFYGCKILKTLVIKSKKLKTVGKNAIKGIHKKAKIDVPNSKRKAYKKLFKTKTGYKKTMSIK